MNYKTLVLIIVVGILSGAAGGYIVDALPKSHDALIKEFYEVETAAHISPHHIRKGISKGDRSFILIDLRSQEEYEEEHIVGAVNVPAYKDPDHSAYGDVERIVGAVRELKNQNPDKELIVYCYSSPCMTGRKIGKMLADHGISVAHLGIGWNDWRYFWTMWNHPHEWENTHVDDYITKGPEPGTYSGEIDLTPCVEGVFGC
jgi:rhodanese-related sulfurtransferase